MPIQRFPYLLISALLVSALTALHITRTQQIQAEQSHSFGRYNSHQVLARAEPLTHLFTHRTNGIRLSASKVELQGEPPRRYWIVDCTDQDGNYIACFSWDAESGHLYFVGHRSYTPLEQAAEPLSRLEAVRVARRWMNDLGIARQASRWRLASTPERNNTVWHVAWEAEGRVAFIQIDSCSGDLIQAKSWRREGPKVAP
jgi:hypothetical protein